MQRIDPYFHFQDARGEITGVTRGMELREANFIRSIAGTVRGGHYHRDTWELFYIISGTIDIVLGTPDGTETSRFQVGPGATFLIEPMELHTFHVLEDASWMNFLSRPIDEADPDIHRP